MPRAFTRAAITVLVAVIIAAVFVAVTVTRHANEAQSRLQQDVVMRGADAISLGFNTALKREWDSLHAVARAIDGATPADINDFMDAVVAAGGRVAWAGVADLNGTIISGSHRLREGQDVSERRWYREGLRRPAVGNAFDSRSLARDENDKPQSLLNLSTPIRDAKGETIGVAVYSLRMAWVASYLATAKEELRIDVVVQDRRGRTLVDTRPEPAPLPENAAAAASFGADAAGAFRLLRDTEGLYAFTPSFVGESLPDFGWRVFAVLDQSSHLDLLPSLLRDIILAVAIAATFVLGATMMVLRLLLRPLECLTDTAADVAAGSLVYPVESRSSREASDLSRALARIQAELATLRARESARDTRYLGVAAGRPDPEGTGRVYRERPEAPAADWMPRKRAS
ncbi:cache domain-containing protein [Salipiger mucosus]|nr:cache domain-containing protein [Salipiger mucosus]